MSKVEQPTHVVGIVGGACAGSVVAEHLAQRGCQVIVFEQNPRPYGKIEDGLPRWHKKQRDMEYRKIDERLDRAGVHFVPNTRLGRDISFADLASEWGLSVLVLANGAWTDRKLDDPRADEVVDKGLVYQNAFVYWFNHMNEAGYDGPRYEVVDEAVVVGGGLASIDVIKILQLELYGRALRARGIEVDTNELEHHGIPKVCHEHGIEDPESLGVKGAVLLYRRRVEDMPLASAAKDAPQKVKDRLPQVRQKILEKCQKKYLFQVQTQRLVKEVVIEDGRLTGVVLLETALQGRDAVPVPGSEHVLRTDLVISSIGSIPEPIEGIAMKGTYYQFKDWDTGEYAALPGVFAAGNVVTGQGNIVASLEHGRFVGEHLAERYLGISDDDSRELGQTPAEALAASAGEAVAEALESKPKLSPEQANALLARVAARQREVGYEAYQPWIQRVTPADME
ncbi:MAG: NAD(P)-binding protein [Planctomycetota bacterium]